MTGSTDKWMGLEPEITRIMSPAAGGRRSAVSLKRLAMFLGGYDEPRWSKDRRPQPLRSRRAMHHFRARLRRDAVTRLKMEGKSFREIGRQLGISQVAAWKLWQQVVDDLAERAVAESKGWQQLSDAFSQMEGGDPYLLLTLHKRATRRFGVMVANRFLGGPC